MDHLVFVRHVNAATVFRLHKPSSCHLSVPAKPMVTRAEGQLPLAAIRRSKSSVWRRRDDVSLPSSSNSSVLDHNNGLSNVEDAAMVKASIEQEADQTVKQLQRSKARTASGNARSHGVQEISHGDEMD